MSTTTLEPPDGPQPGPEPSRHFPRLRISEWVVFTLLAGTLAATNIYTTLLIGWGDTGSIIAVLVSVLLLGLISKHKPAIHTINLGQTMVSAGGSVGFAVASYAAVKIVQPDFDPDPLTLIVLFAAMGVLGALVGASVRRYMVRYFFPSGTACAVIQRTVTAVRAPGERNKPAWLLGISGVIASVLTVPSKISLSEATKAALFQPLEFWRGRVTANAPVNSIGLAVDPLYWGIGIVVGPRIGLGMVLGALVTPLLIEPRLSGVVSPAVVGDWQKWVAIAVLTLPTFATIVFAYLFRTPAVVPPGFTPGRTPYGRAAHRVLVYGMIGAICALTIGLTADRVFGLPWHVSVITMIIAWPLCVVNGRVTGDTDINPVRLVAIVLLSGFFWLISSGTIALLGMAVVGGTLASVAVDMMQDYRTGFLVDANPVHQTTVQFFGSIVGAIVAIPVLAILLGRLGIGEGSSLPAPGARIWAAMADAMAGGFHPSSDLLMAILAVSLAGCLYAYLTVWPRTAAWMPSLFGIGIGMLLSFEACAGIFAGGLVKWLFTRAYVLGKRDEAREEAQAEAGNDTMLVGSAIFAAAAVISILAVLAVTVFDETGWHPFWLAEG